MESAQTPLKINWITQVTVGVNDEDAFWLRFSPIMSINFYDITWEARKHLKPGDVIAITIDLEPRYAQPHQPSEQ